MSGSGLVLVRLELPMRRRWNRAVTVLLSTLSNGPARLMLAGATSSPAGAFVNVSARLTMLPPDCASGPALTVDPLMWMRGAVAVERSRPPWVRLTRLQHAAPSPRLELSKWLPFCTESKGPARVTVLGVLGD